MSLKPLPHHYSMENPASVYDEEAMTALELAGRTTAKVNETVEAFNKLEKETNEHLAKQDADIPVQVADKVLEHIEGGTFDQQIDAHTKELTEQLKATDNRVTNEVNRMALELQATENHLTNRVDNLIVASGGDSSAEVQDARNGFSTLGGYLRETFGNAMIAGPYKSEACDMNTLFDSTTLVIKDMAIINGPDCGWYEDVLLVKVEGYGVKLSATGHPQYGGQYVSNRDLTRIFYRRYYYGQDGVVTFTNWTNVYPEVVVIEDASKSVDKVVKTGHYMYGVANVDDAPTNTAFTLDVVNHSDWIVQQLHNIWNSEMWFRTGHKVSGWHNFADDLNIEWNPWQKLASVDALNNVIASVSENKSNYGYTIVNFGDSIIAEEQGDTSVSNNLAQLTGATVINAGFGGCHMANHWSPDWTPFSMWKIADAIATGDFTEQENKANSGVSGMPAYFVDTVARLKAVDFSKVDVITIGYGTNDYANGNTLGAGTYDKDTIIGALRYSIERIVNAYPNIRVVIVAPCFRVWVSSTGTYVEDSDSKKVSGFALPAVVSAMEEVAKEYHCPVINPYYDMGVNKHNYTLWTADGVHPNTAGRKQLAKLMANTIRGL